MSLLFVLVAVAPSQAHADVQFWSGLEGRVPVSNGHFGVPTHARWVTETRFGGPREGLSLLLARGGPMWELHPNLLFNVNGVQALAADSLGVLRPESRIEIEPNVRGRFGSFTANFRQRAEVRWIAAEPSYRYRIQLRVNYQPEGARVVPFVATELFVATRARLLEMRILGGLSLFAASYLRVDIAYMVRPRQTAEDWVVTHAAIFTITFTPQVGPALESGGG